MIWTTAYGKGMLLSEMSDEHLINSFNKTMRSLSQALADKDDYYRSFDDDYMNEEDARLIPIINSPYDSKIDSYKQTLCAMADQIASRELNVKLTSSCVYMKHIIHAAIQNELFMKLTL